MPRKSLALFGVLTAVLVLGAGCGQVTEPSKKGPRTITGPAVTLKILLPDADWKVTVDGEETEGEGAVRKVQVPALAEGQDHYVVKGLLEPNNYTKRYRTRKVFVKPGQKEAEADLRTENKHDPDLKDHLEVRYVPTPDAVVDAMCDMAKVGKSDVVYDLGCGDGRMVITAVKKFRAQHGVGVDLDPQRIKESKENAQKAGVEDKVDFRVGDVLKIDDLPDASVILLYMGDDINLRLRPILRKRLKPGSRVVSHRFTMGDWEPDKTTTLTLNNEKYLVHLWTIKEDEAKKEAKNDAKTVTLKVLLPDDDWELTVDGKDVKEKGTERLVKVPPLAKGMEYYVVRGLLEPNNYTKRFRTRKVAPKPGEMEVVVDLRKEDPKTRDHIEVRYVPTPDAVVDLMCKMGKVGKEDIVYDLGCGDGRMVITAVKKFHAKRGVGVDIDPVRIKESKENATKAGVEGKVEFRVGDVLKIKDLPDASVVLLYMGDDINERLRPILQRTLKPGSRIVSHRFKMGDWKPDRTDTLTVEGEAYNVLLWTVRAPGGKDADKKE
jgi:uncharacterized protein (TIGR03000 family)